MASNLRSRAKAKAVPILSPKASTSQGESSSPPPGDEEKTKCAICLGDLVNKSYSNSCCHQFCFGCLLEWSKVKPECPLCKSSFTTIIHNIRSDSVYDEYHVPPIIRSPPMPMLSVPYFHHLHGIQDDIMALRSHRFHPYGPSVPAGLAPNWYHRDRHMNFRILEYVSYDRRSDYVNPFRNGQTEFFGTSISMHNDPTSSPISNYQARRRVYDRNQWVEPLRGTLQEGSVVFPSVEYVRTHPTARSRITAWLHRELTVLLGLQMAMHEMANVFDVIMRVLETYDIRSQEFRELVTSYFGDKTRHFQHEFFNFVVSGMTVEEYDRSARYASNRNSRGQGGGGPLFTPPVVTLDDSSEEDNQAARRDESECVLIVDNDHGSSRGASSSSSGRSQFPPTTAAASTSSWLADLPWDLSTGNTLDSPHLHTCGRRRNAHRSSAIGTIGTSTDLQSNEPQDMSSRSRRSSQSVSSSRASQLSQQLRDYEEVYQRLRSQIASLPSRSSQDNSESSVHWPTLLRFSEVTPHSSRSSETEQRASANDGVQSAPVENVNLANEEEQAANNNDDDCVLLGVHPVQKKPPLAVITIDSSDDEEASGDAPSTSQGRTDCQRQTRSQCKNEVFENPEVQVPDVFMEMCLRDTPRADTATTSNAAHRNYVSLSSSSSSASSRAPSPTSTINLSSHRTPPYYFDPTNYQHHPAESMSSVSPALMSTRQQREAFGAMTPTSSKRLRLLDSKKPKSSSKHKKSSSSKKHRSASGSRKKKRNRSPSVSSIDDRRASRKNKSVNDDASSSKKSSKKKKSRRIIYSSSSSEDSDDSSSATSSSGSSLSTHRKKTKHKKGSGSSSNRSSTRSHEHSKGKKTHKSKKKHSSNTSAKKKSSSSRRHHFKRGGPLSREYLSSTDDSSFCEEQAPASPGLTQYSTEHFESEDFMLPSEPPHTLPPQSNAGCSYPSTSYSAVRGDGNSLLGPPGMMESELDEVFHTLTAESAACSQTDDYREGGGGLENNFAPDPRSLSDPSEGPAEDWDPASSSPAYLLNLSGTRNDYWS